MMFNSVGKFHASNWIFYKTRFLFTELRETCKDMNINRIIGIH